MFEESTYVSWCLFYYNTSTARKFEALGIWYFKFKLGELGNEFKRSEGEREHIYGSWNTTYFPGLVLFCGIDYLH